MNQGLNENLKQWLSQLANDWAMSDEQVAVEIGAGEIHNRLQTYPEVRSVLSDAPLDIYQFSMAARTCWALGGKFDAIRFNEFVSKGRSASDAILELIENFPASDEEATERIDDFVTKAVELGYSKPTGSADWAGAALLASVILTALYPNRFVDFRQARWIKFAEALDYEHMPYGEKRYGERLIWAGKFAVDISKTRTFQQYWPEDESLWVISGLCWTGPTPTKPQADPIDIVDKESFPEGAEKRHLHLIRERNQTVVLKAKRLGLERDPLLRCEVCGFSFVETYGELGMGFIKAHHKQPVAELKPGDRTRVEDIALVCANCHDMLHRGDRTLTLDELRSLTDRQKQKASG